MANDEILNAMRHILFWDYANKAQDALNSAVKHGYLNRKYESYFITPQGFRYISQRVSPNCVIPGCNFKQQTKSFCNYHYRKYHRGARGERLLKLNNKYSKELIDLLEKVCRNDGPFDITEMVEDENQMNLVKQAIMEDLLVFVDQYSVKITWKTFAILD